MDPVSIILFIILILLSMFFSASETAFSCIPQHKVDSLIKQKLPGAKALKKVKSEPEKRLSAILIGNNIVNIAAASLATTMSLSLASNIGYNEATIVTISTIIVTVLVLIFGEILPKTFAQVHSEKIGLSISGFYIVFIKILSPIIYLLSKLTKALNKNKKAEITEEEIEAFIDMGKQAGAFEPGEYEKIKNMLNFGEFTAEEAMTPRIKIDAIDDKKTVDEAIEILLNYSHTRIPIYHHTIDDTDRIITLRELLKLKNAGYNDNTLASLPIPPITKIPNNTPIDTALESFKTSHQHIALVMDEYGGVAGVLTLEDIIEEVFGEIQDETDTEISLITQINEYCWTAQSYIRMDELLPELGFTFEDIGLDEEEFSGETLSFFITNFLERFPKKGEEINLLIHKHEDKEHKKEKTDPLQEKGKSKKLTFKVLWIKRHTIGEIQVCIK